MSRPLILASRRAAAALAIAAAGPLTGCGGTHDASKQVAGSLGTPSSSAKIRAEQRAAHRQVAAALKRHLTGPSAQYGTAPSFLPTTRRDGRVLTASRSHRVLAIQGDTVAVHLGHGSAKLTAVGPDVPDEVMGTNATHTQARFDVTLSVLRGTMPVTRRLFSITDEHGHVYVPSVSAETGGRAPAHVGAGKPVSVVLRTFLPAGDGLLRYGFSRTKPIVGWDFTVETD